MNLLEAIEEDDDSENDDDFKPEDDESELEESGEENSQEENEEGQDQKKSKKRKKSEKKSKKVKKQKTEDPNLIFSGGRIKRVDIHTIPTHHLESDKNDKENQLIENQPEKSTVDIDALWDQLNKNALPKNQREPEKVILTDPIPEENNPIPLLQTTSTPVSLSPVPILRNTTPSDDKKTYTVKQVMDFAGEMIEVTKIIEVGSKEEKELQKEAQKAPKKKNRQFG